MFEVLEEWTHGGVIALRVSGKLLHEDYVEIVPKLQEFIARHGAIACLIDVTELEGIALRAVWDELKFDLSHATDVSRCAVVGDRPWERWATQAARIIFRDAELRFFDRVDIDEAASWVHDEPATASESP